MWGLCVSEPSDEALLQAYREGDLQAFEALFRRYRGPLFNFLLRRVRDRGRAEELYQDSWSKVIERAGAFRGDSKFSTWLYTIARNACIDHQRKMKHRGHASLDDAQRGANQPMVERIANPGLSPDQHCGTVSPAPSSSFQRSSGRCSCFGSCRDWGSRRSPRSSAYP
jgi:RNA polymerase sigma-70 factor (ECF subfamily)